jgi:hypothetical protein
LDDEEQVPPAPRALILRSVHLWASVVKPPEFRS